MRYEITALAHGKTTSWEEEATNAAEARRIAKRNLNQVWRGGTITGVRPIGYKPKKDTAA